MSRSESNVSVSRRAVVRQIGGAALGARAVVGGWPVPQEAEIQVVESATPDPSRPFRRAEFNLVGIYDVDWIADPSFARLLDNLSASPGAFGAVRFFGSLSSGTKENTVSSPPPESGTLWPQRDAPIDFSITLDAIAALTSRGLIPFIALTSFPSAVSPQATLPPSTFDEWQYLLRAFFAQLLDDPRFGAAAIQAWWFEVWNEPNVTGFWSGTQQQYFDLYRASSQIVTEMGLEIRLGGPAIAYYPGDAADSGWTWMRAFLRFLSAEPDLKCDFISFHRKGAYNDPNPEVRHLVAAAEEVLALAEQIDAVRFAGLPIINDEADEKVGFDNPFEPRMSEAEAAWQSAVMIGYDALSTPDRRFHAAGDNANLQLVRAPFDGRRSIVTTASPSFDDLIKLPVYGFYELIRLLGETHGTVISGSESLFPTTDLYHQITTGEHQIASLWSHYPTPGRPQSSIASTYQLRDLPWDRVNIARFRIDRTHSNAYTAAGRSLSLTYPSADEARDLRQIQELTTAGPIQHNVEIVNGTIELDVMLHPYAVALDWITPYTTDPIETPSWLEAHGEGDNVVLRWKPSQSPHFYSYDVIRRDSTGAEEPISPNPLRAAMWVDTDPPTGQFTYGIRATTASGITGDIAWSNTVETNR